MSVVSTLQQYLDQPDLVAGWVTDQAVVLKTGQMKATQYWAYGLQGAILRSALEPSHPESYDGLWRRFDAGERYAPQVTKSGLRWETVGPDRYVGFDAEGYRAAIRTGNEVVTLQEVLQRIAGQEQGDDLPIVMNDFGCNYDAACDAIFQARFDHARELLLSAVSATCSCPAPHP